MWRPESHSLLSPKPLNQEVENRLSRRLFSTIDILNLATSFGFHGDTVDAGIGAIGSASEKPCRSKVNLLPDLANADANTVASGRKTSFCSGVASRAVVISMLPVMIRGGFIEGSGSHNLQSQPALLQAAIS